MKILIVRLSAFGDIIHCLPALDDLLARPEIDEVHWLVDERYRFVTEVLPKQVQVHSVALKGKQPLRSAWQVTRTLRHIGFDAVIDLQGLIKSALLSRLCGTPVFGFDKKFLREKPASLLISNVEFHQQERHVVQYYRRIAAGPFSESNDQPIPYAAPTIDLDNSSINEDESLLARFNLQQNGYVILHSAGGWETKQLPETSWLAIAESLTNRDIVPLFSWGNDQERAQAEYLAGQSNGFALPERLNMSALCTLIRQSRAAVGADTGLLHLTAALGRPTITFWGPSASWRSAPLECSEHEQIDQLHWHIESNPECGPCFSRKCDNFVCMQAIQPESIIRILNDL